MKAELAAGKGAHQSATASPPHPHAEPSSQPRRALKFLSRAAYLQISIFEVHLPNSRFERPRDAAH
jgi:hypothetical protein